MPDVDYIKQNVSILDVLNMCGVDYRRSPIICPFHNEKTGSMYIYEDGNQYHCFGCGAHGDIIDFVQSYYECDFKDAVRQISDYFGLGGEITLEQKKRLNDAKKRRKRQATERERLQKEWLKWLTAFTWCDRVLMNKPNMADKVYVKALKNKEYTWYRLKEVEGKMFELERSKKQCGI